MLEIILENAARHMYLTSAYAILCSIKIILLFIYLYFIYCYILNTQIIYETQIVIHILYLKCSHEIIYILLKHNLNEKEKN